MNAAGDVTPTDGTAAPVDETTNEGQVTEEGVAPEADATDAPEIEA